MTEPRARYEEMGRMILDSYTPDMRAALVRAALLESLADHAPTASSRSRRGVVGCSCGRWDSRSAASFGEHLLEAMP